MASNILAELWAIRDGLIMVRKQNINKIHIETDSHIIFQMLNRDSLAHQVYLEMVRDIQALLREFEAVWISFCYQEANRMADELTSLGKYTLFLYKYFDNIPSLFNILMIFPPYF